jgi:hypothetical protein
LYFLIDAFIHQEIIKVAADVLIDFPHDAFFPCEPYLQEKKCTL